GITTYEAAMANAPHLAAAWVTITRNPSDTFAKYPGGFYLMDLGDSWKKFMGLPVDDALKPRIAEYGAEDARLDLRRHYARVNIPIFHVGGWYDIDAAYTLEDFAGLQNRGGDGAKGNQRLIMGAFGHQGGPHGLKYPDTAGKSDMAG